MREKVELVLVGAAAVAVFSGAGFLPQSLPAGTLALTAAGLLLGQGLARDLWLKYVAREGQACDLRHGVAFCAESAIGLGGIAVGALLLAGAAGGTIALTPLRWAALVLGVGLLGFALKDVVFDLRARRLRIAKNHRLYG